MTDLLNNILSSTQDINAKQVQLRVYDGNNTQIEHLLYDSKPDNVEIANSRQFLVTTTYDFNGTVWTLQFEQATEMFEIDYRKAWFTLNTGIVISMLLFLLVRSYLNTRIDATVIAKKLTQELQESESRFRVLADSAPVLIWLADVNKQCYHLNKSWLDFTGRSLEQELGNGWQEGVHSEDIERCINVYTTAFAVKQPFNMEYRLRRYDGEYRWILDTGMPRFSDDGKFLGYIGSCIDITERKQAEQELLKSRQQLEGIIAGTHAGTWEWNVQTGEVIFNERWADIIGYTLAELEPISIQTWLNVCHPDDLKRSNEQLNKHFSGELDYYAIECRVKHKDGHWVWVFDRGKVVSYTEDGKPLLMAGTHIDITYLKEAEEQLRIAATVFESQEGMMVANADKQVLNVNRAFTRITGYSAAELIGQTPRLFHSGRQDDGFYLRMWQSINNIGAWQGEIWNRRKNGEVYPAWLTITAVSTGDQHIVTHYVSTLTDITERKYVENALRESQMLLETAQRVAQLGHYVMEFHSRDNITWTNDASFDDIFGLNEEFERDLHNLARFVHPEDLAFVQQSFQQVFDQQIATLGIEHRIIRPKDGKQKWVAVWGYTFYDDQGQPIRQVGMIQDTTERRQMEDALRASEAKARAIINISPVPMMLLNDEQNKLMFINAAFTNTFGYQLQDIPTLNDWRNQAYPNPNYQQRVSQLWQARLKQAELEKGIFKQLELTVCCKDGTEKTVLETVAVLQEADTRTYLILLYDITERKQAETELRIAATVFESQEGMVITDDQEIILNVNRAFTQITGYTAQEVIGKTPRILQSGKHDKAFYAELWQSIVKTGAWQGEIWNKRKNGEVYPQQLTITAVKNDEGVISHYVTTMVDITERKTTEEYINHLAFYDALTQLPNRRLLQQRLKHGIEVYRRTGSQMAVLMMDLDKFKAVNDTLGHAAGDELLQQVAKRIKARLREVDLVARLGGDEFVILIEQVEHYENLGRIAGSIIHHLSQEFILNEQHKVYIGASIGIAIYPQHGNTPELLIDNADAALYHAKDRGRGCFMYFSDSLTQKVKERVKLENRLRHALEQQELCVYFQPQIDIQTGQLMGAEALVRWFDAERGCLSPSELIALAEETGLIIAIGEWILKETCEIGKQWLNQGFPAITLSVNISPCQFRRSDILLLVKRILKETGFPANYLALEVTEAGLMGNQQHALSILDSLHEQGVHLAIDDFGTGYSSLSYLKSLPIDLIKIDRAFIKHIPSSQNDMAIAASIISIAQHLGLKVLAEGVETVEQLDFLQQQGCDYYQGYLYSQAVPANIFSQFFKRIH